LKDWISSQMPFQLTNSGALMATISMHSSEP